MSVDLFSNRGIGIDLREGVCGGVCVCGPVAVMSCVYMSIKDMFKVCVCIHAGILESDGPSEWAVGDYQPSDRST